MMNTKKPVLFENALEIAIEQTKALGNDLGQEITLIRDLRGRIRILLLGKPEDYENNTSRLEEFKMILAESLETYGFPSEQIMLFSDELLQKDLLLNDRRLLSTDNGIKIFLIERQIIGQDWTRSQLPRETKNPRITVFGIKGGVGRSTAIAIWAWHQARQGRKVIVFDLDLESPGISSTLLPLDYLPDFGIVDWFVEKGVGQSKIVEKSMVNSSPLARELVGELLVVPAYGSKTGDYLSKLSRCYSDFSEHGLLPWAEKVQQIVEQIEKSYKPDLVILDSRAGMHDIAAVLVTRMDAETLLFAVDSPQTWKAYSFLFQHWKNHPQVRDFRQRLQFIAGLIPETNREQYLKRFREHAWDIFRDYLYDEVPPGQLETFGFDLDDEDAPHVPIPIFWHRGLQEFDPATSPDGINEQIAREALGQFIQRVADLVNMVETK